MSFASLGGLLLEDAKTNGVGNLMAALSTEGAGKMSAEEIAAFFDNAGGSVGGSCGNNSFFWQATVLDDSFNAALDVFADIIQRPSFDAKELEIIKLKVLAAIDSSDQNPQSKAMKLFRDSFFPDNPYGLLVLGTKDNVDAIKAEQVANYHKRNILGGSSVLAIYGEFDLAATKTAIEKLFADLPAGEVKLNLPERPTVPADGKQVAGVTEQNLASVLVAVPGMTVKNLEDRFSMDVLDTIMSGYQLPSGWLHNDLRGQQLVYVVRASSFAAWRPGRSSRTRAASRTRPPTSSRSSRNTSTRRPGTRRRRKRSTGRSTRS